MFKQENGFTLVEVLLVVLVLGLFGFGGFYIWNKVQGNDNATNSQISQTASDSSVTQSTSSAEQDISSTTPKVTQYLTIKEWDVKLPLSSAIDDAYYVYKKSGDDRYYLPLSVKSLKNTEYSAEKDGIGWLSRQTEAEVTKLKEDGILTDQDLADKYKKVGDYWYMYTTPVTAFSEKATSVNAGFSEAFSGLVVAE